MRSSKKNGSRAGGGGRTCLFHVAYRGTMIEVVISIVAIFAFISGGLVVWRFSRTRIVH